jgi:hypothetical protein
MKRRRNEKRNKVEDGRPPPLDLSPRPSLNGPITPTGLTSCSWLRVGDVIDGSFVESKDVIGWGVG